MLFSCSKTNIACSFASWDSMAITTILSRIATIIASSNRRSVTRLYTAAANLKALITILLENYIPELNHNDEIIKNCSITLYFWSLYLYPHFCNFVPNLFLWCLSKNYEIWHYGLSLRAISPDLLIFWSRDGLFWGFGGHFSHRIVILPLLIR